MTRLRVGVEVEASGAALAATMATVPWMSPERIALDDRRSLILVDTGFSGAEDACAYAERRIRKSATGMNLDLEILSSEAFPPVVDLRDHRSPTDAGPYRHGRM